MMQRLRRILFSVPMIAAVVLFALYLLGGYLALPAVVKWQLEKQVTEQLGHRINVGEVRFSPLTFRFEVGELALSDPDGRAMLGFKRLLVDFELRSVIDRAWTFAEATLDAPVVRLDLEKDGRHNFSALLDRLRENATEPEPEQETGALPRFAVKRVALTDGRIEFTDRLLAEPGVVHVEPLQIAIDDLSSVPAQPGSYKLSARTAAGETLEASGGIALAPVAASGRLMLAGIKVSTLVRSVSRLIGLDAPTGSIDFAADFDLALDRSGEIAGIAQAIDFDIAALSVNAAGASAPLVAFDTLSLKRGRVDFGKREATLESFRLAKGSLAASMDEQGRIDWTRLARAPVASPPEQATSLAPATLEPPAAPAAAPEPPALAAASEASAPSATSAAPAASPAPAAAPAAVPEASAASSASVATTAMPAASAAPPADPWRISVASVEIADIALRLSDPARKRSATVAAVGLELTPTAEIAGAEARVEIGKPKLSIKGAQLDSGADSFTAPAAVVEAEGVAIVVANGGLEISLDAPRVALPDRIAARSGETALELGSVTAQVDRVAVRRVDAASSGTLNGPKVALSGMSISGADESAQLRDFTFEGQRLALQAGPGQFDVGIDKLRGALADLKMRRGADGVDLGSGAIASEKLSLAQTDAGLRVVSGTPVVSLSSLAAHRGEEKATLGELSLDSGSITLASAGEGRLDLTLERIRTEASKLAMNRGDDGIDLRKATLGGDSIALTQGDQGLRVVGSGARASVAGVAARQGSDRIALQDASFEAKAMTATAGGKSPAPSGLEARLDDAVLQLAALGVLAQGATSDIAQVAAARLGAKSLRLALPDGPADVTADGLTATLSDAVVRSPADAIEMLRLGSVTLAGGAVRLRDRLIRAEKIALADGTAKTWLDAKGQFNWTTVFSGAPAQTDEAATAPTAQAPAAQAPTPPWRVALTAAELDRLAVGFEDQRKTPAFAVGLEAIRARIAGLDTGSATPMQLDVQAQVASGGDIKVNGNVRADNGTSDLQVSVAAVALAPVQTYLADVAELRFASGTVSTAGRLRYGEAEGAKLAYEGRVAVDQLVLEETERKRPFLTWDSVASDDLALTLQPNRLDIGELRIERPSARLIIAEDQSVNLMDVLKKPAAGEEAAGASGDAKAKAASAEPGEDTDDPFPVAVARIRVSGGELDFADLSLRPQFGTRMHALTGVISGLSTDASRSASLQLDAKVDKYGSAKIRGQLSVRRPEQSTELDLTFRNLEMTSLSPYVVKFAGYRIASGRLALDLQYKVRQSKLIGANKIVLNQVELGEKVDSPGALDLPLELAVAILKDSKGVIDIGLPVGGDLNDPKFDYGEVIGKAVGNLLGGIVTAPFRALGALFGGSDDKQLGLIEFEPGSNAIAPPEQQKLETVARALMERPALRLVVPPTYAAKQDTPALKSLAVRSEIVRLTKVELAAGEDPGPIDVANPRVQRAIEAAFSQRYAPAVLEALKRRAVEAAAPAGKETVASAGAPVQESAPKPGSAAAGSASPSAPKPPPSPQPPPAFYQSLVDRLIAEEPVSDETLRQLATRRGEAIVRELTTASALPAARVVLAEPRQASEASEEAVALQLQLEAAE